MAAERHPAARVINLLALVAGTVGLVVVVRQLGWHGLRQAVIGTGAWFVVIALVDLLGSCCDAFGIRGFLGADARIPYRHVFAAQLSGIAINRLTPGNALGEPVKVAMLVRHAPADAAVSAVIQFNLATTFVGIAAIAIGAPVTVLALDIPGDVATIVWSALGVLVVLAVALVVLVRRGALGSLVRGLARLRLVSADRAGRWAARVASIDRRVTAADPARVSAIRRGIAGVLGSRCFNWLGTYLVLHAADIPLSAPLVIASLTVGILITWVSNVVPLGLGLADGTNYMLYGLLGASPVAGLLFTMVNRLRTVVLALMGLSVLAIANAFHRRTAPDPR